MADGTLHQKAVQNRPVVPIIIKAVDQPFIGLRFGSVRSPDDALMEIGYSQPVVFVVIMEQ
ncbi:hypothetical protein D3C74_494780 [compost metagenome]